MPTATIANKRKGKSEFTSERGKILAKLGHAAIAAKKQMGVIQSALEAKTVASIDKLSSKARNNLAVSLVMQTDKLANRRRVSLSDIGPEGHLPGVTLTLANACDRVFNWSGSTGGDKLVVNGSFTVIQAPPVVNNLLTSQQIVVSDPPAGHKTEDNPTNPGSILDVSEIEQGS